MKYLYLFLFTFISLSAIGQTATAPSAGSGKSDDPYLISTLGNLYWMASENAEGGKWSQGKFFLQTNNIDASDTRNWTHKWIPIGGRNNVIPSDTSDDQGTSSNYLFYGVYNGGGYAVDGLVYINTYNNNDLNGFFGMTGSGSVILNLNITNISITTSSQKSGGLVGYSYRTTIYNCSSTGVIYSTNQSVGGLIGQIGGGAVKNSYTACTVTGSGSVGGLAGINQGSVSDCFSTGNVTGNTNSSTGGLLGQASNGDYYRSYTNSPVTTTQAPYNPGGFAGIIRASTAANSFCYWNLDNESDGYNSTSNNNYTFDASGLTSSQLQDINNFDNSWDFVHTWAFGSDGFPKLVNLPKTWLGIDTDWKNPSNWSLGVAPSSNTLSTPNKDIVFIPSGLSNYPSLTGNESAFIVKIADGARIDYNTYTITYSFLINEEEDILIPLSTSETTPEDTPFTFTLTGIGVASATTIVSGPTKGTVSLSNNIATYTPTLNENGTDTFTYKLSNSNTATATITINPVNDPPVAVADTYTVLEDSGLNSLNLVLNDTDIDTATSTLTLTSVTTSGSGTVAINADNKSVDYTPANNFNGTETITYTVSDGSLSDNTGVLTITVTPVNDPPVAVADAYSVLEDSGLNSLNLVLNDTDIDTATSTLTLISVTTSGSGTVAINADNKSVDYTPANNYN